MLYNYVANVNRRTANNNWMIRHSLLSTTKKWTTTQTNAFFAPYREQLLNK